jgi:hypothetical protein
MARGSNFYREDGKFHPVGMCLPRNAESTVGIAHCKSGFHFPALMYRTTRNLAWKLRSAQHRPCRKVKKPTAARAVNWVKFFNLFERISNESNSANFENRVADRSSGRGVDRLQSFWLRSGRCRHERRRFDGERYDGLDRHHRQHWRYVVGRHVGFRHDWRDRHR